MGASTRLTQGEGPRFVLWVLTGPMGVIAAAILTYGLLRLSERQDDGARAAARKAREAELSGAFRR